MGRGRGGGGPMSGDRWTLDLVNGLAGAMARGPVVVESGKLTSATTTKLWDCLATLRSLHWILTSTIPALSWVLLMWRWRQFLPAWIQILRRQGNSQLSLMRIMRSPEEMARGRGHGAAQHCAAPITISIITWCIASLRNNNRISTNKHKDNKNVKNVIFSPPPNWIMVDNSTVGLNALKRMSNCSQCGFFNQFCGLMIVMDKQGSAVTIISLLLTNH